MAKDILLVKAEIAQLSKQFDHVHQQADTLAQRAQDSVKMRAADWQGAHARHLDAVFSQGIPTMLLLSQLCRDFCLQVQDALLEITEMDQTLATQVLQAEKLEK